MKFSLGVIFFLLIPFHSFGYVNGTESKENFGMYNKTDYVAEGELCGDVFEDARMGGTYYRCEDGLKCNFVNQDSGHIREPYGRCVTDEVFACKSTGGAINDDLSCNCPMSKLAQGCDGKAIEVTHTSTYDDEKSQLIVTLTARSRRPYTVQWTEWEAGCEDTNADTWGVKLRLIDPPYQFSPISNPLPSYTIGSKNEFYEFENAHHMFKGASTEVCQKTIQHTYKFASNEVKRATIVIPGDVLESKGYEISAKYGRSFEYVSQEKPSFMIECDKGRRIMDGKCRFVKGYEPPSDFTDIKTHWARSYILDLAEKGIIHGYYGGHFGPNDYINRAEFLTLLMRGFHKDLVNYPRDKSVFRDVYPSDWFAGSVYTAVQLGVVEGYMDSTFKPGNLVTRAEAVAMTIRAADLPVDVYEHSFFRDVRDAWQKPFIETAYRLNIVNGFGDGTFRPRGKLTRAEAAKIISNILNLDRSNTPKFTWYSRENLQRQFSNTER